MLHYTATHADGRTEDIADRVPVEHFRGRRYLFRCPGCDARRGSLFKTPAGTRFRCRICHGLTYTTRLESDPQARLLGRIARRMGCSPKEAERVMMTAFERDGTRGLDTLILR